MREQQVRAVYRAALERPVADRASFIAELTGDDQELRQSVELLLSSHDATDVGARAAERAEARAELAAGTPIAHYRIDAVLGRGGMGVVYRATDTKLNRPVAIKFLAAAVTDADVRRRFKQEAQTTSSLNHPHIVTVYDVGEHDGQQYIVSELVDGGTLAEWSTETRRRTWRQIVDLMTGVADALAAAHAAGVLHRDVKPGNILIGGNGYAKLADFGLAKLVDNGTPASADARKASRNTRAGVVVGTVAYMSPEQAAGQPLDARNDVFSFGIVMYELLAGRRPFDAPNELEVLKSIAHATPVPLPETVPEALRTIIDKALEKDPADRYQTMQDLVVDLRRLTRKQAGSQAATSVVVERRRARVLSIVAAGLAVALVVALVPVAWYFMRPTATPASQIRFEMPAAGYVENGLAISPDGERVAYTAIIGGVRQIWVRPIGALAARAVVGTENAQGVFWSPDSKRLAFVADGKLKTIDASGGPATAIAAYSAPLILAGAWTPDGTILFTTPHPTGSGLGVGRVSSVGGTPTLVTTPDFAGGELGHFIPRMLPDGKHFLYGAGSPSSREVKIYAASLATPGRVPLLTIDVPLEATTLNIAYAQGFLLYGRSGALFAQRVDPAALALRGEAVPIADDVAEFSVVANALVYRPATAAQGAGAPEKTRRLVWFDRSGQRLGELEAPPSYRLPVLSPDGRHVSLSVGAGLPDVWTIDIQRGVTTRLTFDDAADDAAAWSPDADRIVFNSGRDGAPGVPSSLYQRATNGTGSDERLIAGKVDELLVPFDWSSDGRFLLFGRMGVATWRNKSDLWVLEMSGERTASALIESPFRKGAAKFAPDGRWIAFSTNESKDFQVVVQPFPEVARGKWQVSTHGGIDPRWRADGRELFYLDPDGVMMAVDVRADGDVFEPGAPHSLFKTGLTMPGPDEQPDYLYNVTADGERFLINEPVAPNSSGPGSSTPETTTPLNVIVNWAAGLGQK